MRTTSQLSSVLAKPKTQFPVSHESEERESVQQFAGRRDKEEKNSAKHSKRRSITNTNFSKKPWMRLEITMKIENGD